MVSFRFHVVSITAVFLAIAIGVVVGSTYVDRAIVDNLQNRIDTVSANLDARKEVNDALEVDLGSARGYIEASRDFAVTDRLTDVPVLVVAPRGVDAATVEDTVLLARRAGAIVPGVAWLEPMWALDGDGHRRELAAILDAAGTAEPEALWAAAWEGVAEELVEEPAIGETDEGGETDETGETDDATDVEGGSTLLLALQEAGFLTFDGVGDDATDVSALVGAGVRVLVVTGTETDDGLAPLVPTVVAASHEAGLTTVVADIYVVRKDGPARGEALVDSLEEALREAVAVVDTADRSEGRVAAVLALAGDDLVGHFGYGAGADAVLPDWSPP